MIDVEQCLIDFHDAFGSLRQSSPNLPPERTKVLRKRLLHEEFNELIEAIDNDDLVGIVSEAVDLVYVTVGACVSYGLPFMEVFEAIHEANLRKLVDCPMCSLEYEEYGSYSGSRTVSISDGCEKCRFTGKISLKDPGGKMMKPLGWQKADVESIINNLKEKTNAVD